MSSFVDKVDQRFESITQALAFFGGMQEAVVVAAYGDGWREKCRWFSHAEASAAEGMVSNLDTTARTLRLNADDELGTAIERMNEKRQGWQSDGGVLFQEHLDALESAAQYQWEFIALLKVIAEGQGNLIAAGKEQILDILDNTLIALGAEIEEQQRQSRERLAAWSRVVLTIALAALAPKVAATEVVLTALKEVGSALLDESTRVEGDGMDDILMNMNKAIDACVAAMHRDQRKLRDSLTGMLELLEAIDSRHHKIMLPKPIKLAGRHTPFD